MTYPHTPRRSPIVSTAMIGLKLAVAGAVICAIALTFVVLDVGGEVRESQADIFDFGFGPKPNQVRFQESLSAMGHPEPQVFDLNGNIIHFSVSYHDGSPHDVMRRYQEDFVNRGLNDRVFLDLAPRDEEQRMVTRLTGGLAPIDIAENKVVMGGMLTKNKALTEDHLLTEELIRSGPLERFRGHRWVEIYRQPGSSKTTAIASWSDENFSYARMLDDARTEQPLVSGQFDSEIPACPGCTQVNSFADLKDRKGYASKVFVTSMSADQMFHFYLQAMRQRGWIRHESQEVYDLLQKTGLHAGSDLKKLSFRDADDRGVEILILPMEQGQIAIQTILWEELE